MNMGGSQDLADYSDMSSGNNDEEIVEKERFARESHCEIERRRRTKMTSYINELCDMVPSCTNLTRKPDKLTILRMAVAHMKTLRGPGNTGANGEYKPSFLSDQELKHLVLEAADGFLFAVSCDSGELVYLNDSFNAVLNHNYQDWLHRSLFDLVHPEDCEKLREQLCLNDSSCRMLDMKSGTVKKDAHQVNARMSMATRRGFICRMRIGNMNSTHVGRCRQRQVLGPSLDGHHYAVVHVTGYVKNWNVHRGGTAVASHSMPMVATGDMESESGGGGNQCLVAIGRLQVTSQPTSSDLNLHSQHEFITRHSSDSTTSFCDQRVFNVLGYESQELIGKTFYDFVHPDDHVCLKQGLEAVLKSSESELTLLLHVRSKSGELIALRTHMYCFRNPYSDEVEYIVATNTSAKSLQQAAAAASELNASSVLFNSAPSGTVDHVLGSAIGRDGSGSGAAPGGSLYNNAFKSGAVLNGFDYAAGRPSAICYTSVGLAASGSSSNTSTRGHVRRNCDDASSNDDGSGASSWRRSECANFSSTIGMVSSGYGSMHIMGGVADSPAADPNWYRLDSTSASAGRQLYSRLGGQVAPAGSAYWTVFTDASDVVNNGDSSSISAIGTESNDYPDILRGVLASGSAEISSISHLSDLGYYGASGIAVASGAYLPTSIGNSYSGQQLS